MIGYWIHIDASAQSFWTLFLEDSFPRDCGAHVNNALKAVRDVFVDIFGSETVESHKTLAVVSTNGDPVTYRENSLIFLNEIDQNYVRVIYQFGHELCHFIGPTTVCDSFRWLEETLCEAMSWYVLQRLYQMRSTKPISDLENCYDSIPGFIKTVVERLDLRGKSASRYIRENIQTLQADCYNREANAAIADAIYPFLEADKTLWQIVPRLSMLTNDMSLSNALSVLVEGMEGNAGQQFIQALSK